MIWTEEIAETAASKVSGVSNLVTSCGSFRKQYKMFNYLVAFCNLNQPTLTKRQSQLFYD